MRKSVFELSGLTLSKSAHDARHVTTLGFLFFFVLAACQNPLGTLQTSNLNFHPGFSGTIVGDPVAATSTVTGTGPVTANGVATSTITITLKDANGNLVSGYRPTFAATDTGATNVYTDCSVGVAGVSTCTMTSTKAETKTLSITTPVAKAHGSVEFQAGIPTAGNSTLSVPPASVIADGATTVTVTVTLKDAFSNLVSGKAVTLASSRGVTDTVATVSGTSNASGVATFTVRSSTTGTATLTATDTTDAVVVTQTGKVLFLAATPWTDYQAQNWDGASNPGSNSSSIKDTWKDLAVTATTNDGDLTPSGATNFAFTNVSGWGGNGTTTITGGADGPYRLLFDGTDDWVKFGTGVNSNNDFSFETWVRPANSGGIAKVIISNGATSNSGTATEANIGITLKQSRAQAGKIELHLGEKSYADEVLADSPIAYWRLGESTGTTAQDSSGNARIAEYVGSPSLAQTHGSGWGDGDTAVNLNGFSQYVRAAHSAVYLTTPQITLEAWVKRDVVGAAHGIVSKGGNGAYASFAFLLAADNSVYFLQSETTAAWETLVQGGNINDLNWHHIVAFNNGVVAELYIDGSLVASDNTPAAIVMNSSDAIHIGAEVQTGTTTVGRYLDGTIDEVAIYNTPLSSGRITAHYYAGLKRLSCTATSILANSNWHHLAGVFSSAGPTLRLMVNGTQECSVTLAGAAYTGSGNDLRAGRDQNLANSWSGAISDLRTYSSGLTQANLQSNFMAVSERFPDFPKTVTGLQVWLKADAGLFTDTGLTTAVTTDGQSVGGWQDQSGNGNHATQATVGFRATYQTSEVNSKPILRFDGIDDKMTNSTLSLSQPYTLFMVFKYITLTTNDVFFDSNPLILKYGAFGMTNTPDPQIYAGANRLGTIAMNTSYNLYSVEFNTSASLAYRNGASFITSGNAGSDALTGYTLANVNALDGRDLHPDIDLAEVIIYNLVLSESDRKRVEAYLNAKYSLY